MKILVPLEAIYPSQAGGAANAIHWVIKKLHERGFEFDVVATDKGLASNIRRNCWIATESGRAIFVKTRFIKFPFLQTLASLAALPRFKTVYISSVFYLSPLVTGLAARVLKKK